MKKAIFGTLAAAALVGCSGGQGTLQMTLTDAPADIADAQSVIVTIDEVKAHVVVDGDNDAKEPAESDTTANDVDEGKSGWRTICSKATDFDLLTLTNGKTTPMCEEAAIDVGKVTQIRLIVSKAVIKWKDTSVADTNLEAPSAAKTGLKIVGLSNAVKDGEKTEILLDFDAAESIIKNGQGYQLKPTIKVKK